MSPALDLPGRWEEPAAEGDGLAVWLRAPLADRLEVGRGSGLLVHGAAVHERHRIRSIEIELGGVAHRALADSMPSPGLALERPRFPGAQRAIFWAIATLPGSMPAGELELLVAANLDHGTRVKLVAKRLEVAATEPAAGTARVSGPPAVAICMATHEPPIELLERQVGSLRAQTLADWTCSISDDASSPEAFARIERLTASDPRFAVSRAERRAGPYRNFARALSMVPPRAAYVALCDQDDFWYPDKLEALVAALGEARLVFSDMRVTTPGGDVVADTYWTSRRPNHENFASLLLGNSVTGAASLFRRELLDDALPLPPRTGNLFHDHWLALVAAATGEIAYLDRPLYDYVQHDRAVIGHAGANRGVVGGGRIRRLAALRGRPPGQLRGEWRRIYFAEYCRMALSARALEARLGSRIGAGQRRALRLAVAVDGSPAALAWLAGRQLRRLVRDDTGGSEAGMLRGLAWRRALANSRRCDPLDDADLPPGIVEPGLTADQSVR